MPYQPHDGDRVRLDSFTGLRGRVTRCTNRKSGEKFWRVKLDDARWTGLQRVVADSTGTFNRECSDCEIRFLAAAAFDSLCPNCERRERERDGRQAVDARPSHDFGVGINRPRAYRTPVNPNQEQSS